MGTKTDKAIPNYKEVKDLLGGKVPFAETNNEITGVNDYELSVYANSSTGFSIVGNNCLYGVLVTIQLHNETNRSIHSIIVCNTFYVSNNSSFIQASDNPLTERTFYDVTALGQKGKICGMGDSIQNDSQSITYDIIISQFVEPNYYTIYMNMKVFQFGMVK